MFKLTLYVMFSFHKIYSVCKWYFVTKSKVKNLLSLISIEFCVFACDISSARASSAKLSTSWVVSSTLGAVKGKIGIP